MTANIVVFDYGFGNVRSACRAFEEIGARVSLTKDFQEAVNADGLVIPGVGAFNACMQGLVRARGNEVIEARRLQNKQVLGICVGHQIFFEQSFEGKKAQGLGVFKGEIRELPTKTLPHMGWNTVLADPDFQIFQELENERFYFVHSFANIEPPQSAKLVRTTHENIEFTSAITDEIITGVQFHPEKSGKAGLKLLRNWLQTL